MGINVEGLELPGDVRARAISSPHNSPYAMRLAGIRMEEETSMVPTAIGFVLAAAGLVAEAAGKVVYGRFNKTGVVIGGAGIAIAAYGYCKFNEGTRMINESWLIQYAPRSDESNPDR